MSLKIGLNCKLYYSDTELDGDTVTPATATWVEIDIVRDVSIPMERGKADLPTRGSTWNQSATTLLTAGLEFQIKNDTADAGYIALRDAFINNTEIAVAAMDGDIEVAGAEGLASNMMVENFTRGEPLEEGVSIDVRLCPSSQTEWYESTGS